MIDREMAESCFANRLRAVSRAISKQYDAGLRPLDIKVSQLSVLTAVSMGGGALTIVEIAAQLGMDRSTLSRNLDPLERRGLVEVGPEARHRARKVALTEAGAALLRAAYPLWQQSQAAAIAAVDGLAGVLRGLDPLVRGDD